MIALSFRRNDSSTAFLIHWCTVHWPTPWRVATRSRPLFSSEITCSTASATSLGADLAEMLARFSHAVSMICWSCWVIGLLWSGLDELDDALRGFHAFRGLGNQRHADAAGAGVQATAFAGKVTARQHRDIVLSQQVPGELNVASTHTGPQIKARVGQLDIHARAEHGCDFREFALVQGTVFDDVLLVGPCRDAGLLHHRAHGAAMVGA